jgi:ubiquinone/menaquinone biosynthesis C-methylase UbiE
MAVDRRAIAKNLRRFYDFRTKTVLLVGAGHGHLIEGSDRPKQVIAVDCDHAALRDAREQLFEDGRSSGTDFVCANFEELFIHCDVVYFEFCLHEIVDPRRALGHARSLAPDIVLIDHSRDSEWAFYAEEEEKSLRSWAALQKFLIRRREGHCAEQRFQNYSELATKTEAKEKP